MPKTDDYQYQSIDKDALTKELLEARSVEAAFAAKLADLDVAQVSALAADTNSVVDEAQVVTATANRDDKATRAATLDAKTDATFDSDAAAETQFVTWKAERLGALERERLANALLRDDPDLRADGDETDYAENVRQIDAALEALDGQ